MQNFIKNHITSPGFQSRFRNVYLPLAKTLLAAPVNKLINSWNSKWYEEQMRYSEEKVEVEEEETFDASNFDGIDQPLDFDQAVNIVKSYKIDHEDQDFGMCVTHTVKNIYRFAAKALFEAKVDFSEHDIYIDRATRGSGIDAGMSSSRTLDRIIEKGVAIDGIVPDPKRELDLNTTRDDYPDAIVNPFRIRLIKERGYISSKNEFEKIWAFINSSYNTNGVRPFQVSITAMRGWWTSDVPTATGTVYGGHSAMALNIPFMYGDKRAFFCFDSSYRSGLTWKVGTGIRIVTEDCWKGLGRAVRPVTFVDEVEKALGGTVVVQSEAPVDNAFAPELFATAKFEDQSEAVTAIQKALMYAGYDITAISSGNTPYGYYGAQTAAAVMKFHYDNWTMFNGYTQQSLQALEGKSFGNLSVAALNKINGY